MHLVVLIDEGQVQAKRVRDIMSEIGEFIVKAENKRLAGNEFDTMSIGVYQCDTPEIAAEMAKTAVRAHPALTAYISEPTKLVTAEMPKPLVKLIKPKAVLPQ